LLGAVPDGLVLGSFAGEHPVFGRGCGRTVGEGDGFISELAGGLAGFLKEGAGEGFFVAVPRTEGDVSDEQARVNEQVLGECYARFPDEFTWGGFIEILEGPSEGGWADVV
jgi:hypothetical protein